MYPYISWYTISSPERRNRSMSTGGTSNLYKVAILLHSNYIGISRKAFNTLQLDL